MSGSDPLRHLATALETLRARALYRDPDRAPPRERVVLCSNDYLGYASEPWDAPMAAPGGAGASRLIAGEHATHSAAEAALARWVGLDAALLFSSGYAANVGTIAALAEPGDLIVSDALNHASIIDGCRLSGARIAVVPHVDADAVRTALREAGGAVRRWVITETYFSMDGDSPDLRALREICQECDAALVVDEAHALGVFGPEGAGLCAALDIRPDVLIGTLGKAVALQGAFVAGAAPLRAWLWNRARSFVFSTGVSPVLAAAIGGRVARVRADDLGRARLRATAARLRGVLQARGAKLLGRDDGPLVPWVLGTPERALSVARALEARGIHVPAIRPPTVPAGAARLRVAAGARVPEEALAAFEGGVAALPARCFT